MNIVVDTNVLSYFWLPGSRTAAAAELRRATDEWLAPRIWRSEFRNVLAGYIRARSLDLAQAKAIMRACEADLANREREVDSLTVLDLVDHSSCSAYDCEFVALAQSLGLKLVTEDRRILRDFPKVALSMSEILG